MLIRRYSEYAPFAGLGVQHYTRLYPNEETTYLHVAIEERRDTKFGKSLLDESTDNIDYHNYEKHIDTPLHVGCRKGAVDWICMLLYYGADPNIPSEYGLLPISEICTQIPEEQHEFLIDVLLPYTFGDDASVSLRTLAAAMTEESSLFRRVLNQITRVTYGSEDVEFLFQNFSWVKAKHFKVFVGKFGRVVDDLIEHGLLNEALVKVSRTSNMQEILDTLLYSCNISKLGYIDLKVRNARISGLIELKMVLHKTSSIIAHYVNAFGRDGFFTEEEITERVLLMLSYGLGVTIRDLDIVHRRYGCCELFRILLQMDIESEDCDKYVSAIVLLYCNPRRTIESCFDDPESYLTLLDFYNDARLKKKCLSYLENKRSRRLLIKLNTMPDISTLVELSRNAARKHIAEKFKIENLKELYMVLNRLPIDRTTSSIIALERKLY